VLEEWAVAGKPPGWNPRLYVVARSELKIRVKSTDFAEIRFLLGSRMVSGSVFHSGYPATAQKCGGFFSAPVAPEGLSQTFICGMEKPKTVCKKARCHR